MRLARRLARALGYELLPLAKTREPMGRLVRALRHFAIDAVIDVGANEGQYAKLLRASGWAGPILSFEPIPAVHAALVAATAADPLWHVAPPMALGEHDGEIQIGVSGETDMSSILPRSAELDRISPSSAAITPVTVPLRRLAGICELLDPAWRRLFLKIDVQGYESRVLDGVGDLWPRIVGLQLELALVPLYSGEVGWRAMIDRLEGRGYLPWLFLPGYVDPKLTRELQMDGVFFDPAASSPTEGHDRMER